MKLFILCALSCCVVSVRALGLLGPGQWLVLNILECEDPEQYPMVFDAYRRKLNRTHDCFTGTFDSPYEVNSSYAIAVDVYKKMDGGFKFYQTIMDDCVCTFLMQHAKENIQRILSMSGVDPPDCPVKPGFYSVENFVMDYTELPLNGVYGTYEVVVFLTLDGRKMSCIKGHLLFENSDDDDEDDD
ncbi:uncharacterized protein LOC113500311 [Trichoplusia ni]|uniref:Uncharacterized protein LOC113500311 n=1 Tax=Trichoplusia ni TaxID=7111 RepID=A0A7E5W848_TRINI|nr:uncharacterized protein LOC113500311 [Trichoplusia ni]